MQNVALCKFQISVCKNEKKINTKSNYQRAELEIERSHTYKDIIEVAANYLKLDGSNFRLYRPRGGALTLTSLNGKTVPWTLGSYMRLRHLGPDALQLGIGPSI